MRARLAEHRLVTLTGAGGVGKTRLALEAAHGLTAEGGGAGGTTGAGGATGAFPDGVWLAELGGLADPDLVPQAIAAAVGVDLDPDAPPADALADALAARRLLLVLDNCEHLVDACAALTEALLDACPGVRLLATSREPLGAPARRSSGCHPWRSRRPAAVRRRRRSAPPARCACSSTAPPAPRGSP